MEFHKKLQELRKQKGLTQEALAQALYVSRTAVSKWESGRGYPNLDSLKAIAEFFSVTVDQLLSCDEALSIAVEDQKRQKTHFLDLLFGLLDLAVVILLFLPFFGQAEGDRIRAVSLLSLTTIAPYLKIAYMTAVIGCVLWGILTLALQGYQHKLRETYRRGISLAFNLSGALLCIISSQPYAAILLLIFLTIKTVLLFKKQ